MSRTLTDLPSPFFLTSNNISFCPYLLLLLLLSLFIYLTLTEVKAFTIKNICIAVAILLNGKDGMLIKVNEKNNYKGKIKYNG